MHLPPQASLALRHLHPYRRLDYDRSDGPGDHTVLDLNMRALWSHRPVA
jgi:hypothetical protein